ncbi:CysB family HTH-type transcriptional regulator [Pigmentiphaga aceris]|uniref:CysB family HTH-type transcriptional regulator n=1 Tax=Pigmentiphaga aceris TaxID=1940612 RepID=A0A5C0AVT5_9BURK|nr:CysB family HTH-type transcriptional regulator [Pigmentiphaga aceris]QEI05473.1 CysB family HTH-type transcriptional regulator [Pigmentiphaga aceris]
MNFQQLRSVREALRRDFNLTEVAHALDASQPGVSRQIRELEDELGVAIFERAGKRLTGLTEPGREIVKVVERLLIEQENLKRAALEFTSHDVGRLTVATTHSQARYALLPVIQAFRQRFPGVHLSLQQGAPEYIASRVATGQADVGIASEGLSHDERLCTFPGYRWNHVIVVPHGHPLLGVDHPTLHELGRYPLITYDLGLTGRSSIDEAFARAGLAPDIVLTAMDADVIKTYVAAGLGVGIIASVAYKTEEDRQLQSISSTHLFKANMTRVAVRRGAYLRDFTVAFIEMFAPHLNRRIVTESDITPGALPSEPLVPNIYISENSLSE